MFGTVSDARQSSGLGLGLGLGLYSHFGDADRFWLSVKVRVFGPRVRVWTLNQNPEFANPNPNNKFHQTNRANKTCACAQNYWNKYFNPLVGMDEASQPNEKFVYSNDSLKNSSTEYSSNVVVTSKYTPMNFVFLFLFESFNSATTCLSWCSCGDFGVGKSCLILRFAVYDTFPPNVSSFWLLCIL